MKFNDKIIKINLFIKILFYLVIKHMFEMMIFI